MISDLKGRKVVLVGGAGFIGHNLALALARAGAHVEIIDSLHVNNLLHFASARSDSANRGMYLRMLYRRLEALNEIGIALHVQDARDYHGLSRIITSLKPDVIVHLAAVAHAGRSNKDPYSTFDHSLRTLENALDCARDFVEHFIFFSSSMAYGNFLHDEVTEDHPLNPVGIYGALKVAGEKMVIAYQQVFGLNYTIIRPSALYGPGCVSRRVGQVFIENAFTGLTLRVDGDGGERLDFTYIDDLIQGTLLMMQNPAARNEIFNLTYGASRPVSDLVAIIRRYFPDARVESVERDGQMPVRGTLNIKKAVSLLGYDPQFPIETGFPTYIDWYREFLSEDIPKALPTFA